MLSSTALKMGDATFIALFQAISSDHLEISLFKSTFKYANDRKDTTYRNEEKVMVEKGIRKCICKNT